jgi:ABC-type Fe3+-hydroxamate transport system substrate-binding protein
MAAGTDTFISKLLNEFGGQNLITNTSQSRYPNVSNIMETLAKADKILLSSEPFPFREKHIKELVELCSLREENIKLIDGELCSWHGSRMLKAFQRLPELLK